MSATVLGCGHTSHQRLFTIDVITTAPQVHLHFLTDDSEYEELGYAKVELCCHGCGASTLVYYTNNGKTDRRVQVRDEFARKHSGCPNRSYQSHCPDWRSTFKRVDLRPHAAQQWEEADPPKRKRMPKVEYVPALQPRTRARKAPTNRQG
jgi:hypothetical protein